MKKIIAILLSVMMVFSMTGCQKDTPDEEKPLIGFSMSALDSTMKLTLDNFERVAKERGWDYVSLNADGDTAKELDNCNNLISLGCKVVVIMICDSDASVATIKAMTEAGVKVIIAGRSANAAEEDYYCYVSGSQALGGICQADYVNQWLKDNPDETLNIAFIHGLATSVPARLKYEAFLEYCVNNPENAGRVNLVVEDYADAQAEKAYNLTTDWMQTYPEINCFVTQADDMTSGVVNALKGQGYNVIDDFLIISADGNSVGIAGLKSKEFDATVCLSLRALGDKCGEAAAKAFAGEACDKTVDIDGYYKLMTLENVDEIAEAEGIH